MGRAEPLTGEHLRVQVPAAPTAGQPGSARALPSHCHPPRLQKLQLPPFSINELNTMPACAD